MFVGRSESEELDAGGDVLEKVDDNGEWCHGNISAVARRRDNDDEIFMLNHKDVFSDTAGFFEIWRQLVFPTVLGRTIV